MTGILAAVETLLLDLTNVVFVRWHLINWVLLSVLLIFLAYLAYSIRTWTMHKKWGGYGRSKKAAKTVRSGISGPLTLFLKIATMTALALILGLLLLVPKIKEAGQDKEYEPAQLVIGLDCTLSMLAEDIQPSRLEASKKVINRLIERLKREGNKDKMAFLRFTDIGIPAVIVPTKDYSLIEQELWLTNNNYVKRFEKHGTNLWDVITQGLQTFDHSEKDQIKIMVIISDGEQTVEKGYTGSTMKEAIELRHRGNNENVKIFIIGIGESREPSLIPKKKDEFGNVVEYYAKIQGQEAGRLVETSPDPAYLQEVALIVNGKFISSTDNRELEDAFGEILAKERKVIGPAHTAKLRDASPVFIGICLILLMMRGAVGLG